MIVTCQSSREATSYTLTLKGAASELELEALKKHLLEILTPQSGKRIKLFLDCHEYVEEDSSTEGFSAGDGGSGVD